MNLTLAGIGVVILAVIAGLWAWTRRARKAGEDGIARDVAETTADTLVRQDKAATEAASEDVVSRLRKGGF